MENEKVSIIIPAYNSESTVERAVSSALSQSYANIEVIVVDDGSPDRTAETVERLASKDERVKLIRKANGGVSSARNAGIRAAQGEWFITLDADDYIDSEMVEKLYRDVSLYETDVSICGFRRVFDNGKKEVRRSDVDFQGTLEEFLNTVFINLFDEQLIHTHSNKLYRTSLVRDKELYYTEGMNINEDICFSLRYLRHCRSVSVVEEAYLNYVQHGQGESLVTKYNKNGLETCFDVLRAYDELFDSCNVDDEIINAMNNRIFFHICGFAGMPYYKTDCSDEEKLQMIRKLSEREDFRRLIAQTDPIGLKNSVALFLFKHNKPGLYHRLCKLLYRGKLYTSRRPEESKEELTAAEDNPDEKEPIPDENIKAQPEPEAVPEAKQDPITSDDANDEEELEVIPEVESGIESEPEPEIEREAEPEAAPESEPEPEFEPESEPEPEPEPMPSDESEEKLPAEIEKVINEALKEEEEEKPHHRKRKPVIREIKISEDDREEILRVARPVRRKRTEAKNPKSEEDEEYRQIELSDLFDL